jgi:release factor glutamine methyltransferase
MKVVTVPVTMNMTVGELQKWAEEALAKVSPSYLAEARTLLCHVLECTPLDLVLNRTNSVDLERHATVKQLVEARMDRVPIQYLIGTAGFYGLDFFVDQRVLIPRPETESLVEFILKQASGKSGRILEIGVGSGAIAITLATKLEGYEIVGCDIDSSALEVAKVNGIHHGVDHKIKWIKSDLFTNLEREVFDVIVSNPPYIPMTEADELEPEVIDNEPHLALFADNDGLDFYYRIIPEALDHLVVGGVLAFEAGHNQCEAIQSLFLEYGYVEVGCFEDLNGIPRFIHGKKAPIGG